MYLEEIKTILSLEEKYKSNDYNGINNGGSNFKIINGTIPIVLSAPHAVKQYREGNVKEQDGLTGSMVEYLCMKTGCSGIIRTYNLNDDPNYENEGQALKYKEAILRLIKENNIKFLIDVHGCTDKHGFDIEIGTNYGKNINQDTNNIQIFKEEFSKIGKVVVDEKFTAGRSTTVSSFINRNSKIPCVQLEISRKFRRDCLLESLDTLQNIIKRLYININQTIENIGSRDIEK